MSKSLIWCVSCLLLVGPSFAIAEFAAGNCPSEECATDAWCVNIGSLSGNVDGMGPRRRYAVSRVIPGRGTDPIPLVADSIACRWEWSKGAGGKVCFNLSLQEREKVQDARDSGLVITGKGGCEEIQ
jgi:hypothetical protein